MKKNVKVGLSIFSLVILVGALAYFGVIQTYLSQSNFNVGADGKGYWVLTGVADAVSLNGNGYNFQYNPTQQTLANGNIIKPQSSLNLQVSKGASYCEYQLQPQTNSFCAGFFKLQYSLLGNAQKTIQLNVKDMNTGKTIVMDGTVVDTDTMQSSNGGTLSINSAGTLGGKSECPPGNTVAVMNDKNGNAVLYSTSDVQYIKDQLNGFGCLNPLSFYNLKVAGRAINSQFISGFNSNPTITTQTVKGNTNLLGSAVFTLTASQDYFNSVVIVPPKPAVPSISSISVPSLKQGASGSMKVVISNNGPSGTIVVTATSNQLSISPSSQNVQLDTSKTLSYPITAVNTVGSGSVTIKACSTSQFFSTTCDSESQSFSIVSSATKVPTSCGDGICQSVESSTSCPSDCYIACAQNQTLTNGVCVNAPTPGFDCSFPQVQGVVSKTQYRFWELGGLTGKGVVISTNECITPSWVPEVIIGAVVFSLGAIYLKLRSNRPKRRK